uniref:Uncharacterized protein n=1 Tax=Nomascus leucogenys TaxID=61853 RepID=A0A2I3GM55_NOMLE
MLEGLLVRTFHHLVSPFVGKQVVKIGSNSKNLQSLWLQDSQVGRVLWWWWLPGIL